MKTQHTKEELLSFLETSEEYIQQLEELVDVSVPALEDVIRENEELQRIIQQLVEEKDEEVFHNFPAISDSLN